MENIVAIAKAEDPSREGAEVTAAIEALHAAAHTTVVRTARGEDIDAALRDHRQADVVVVLGGDGSLHAVVNAMARTQTLATHRLALVALGTGNDFARTVGLADLSPTRAAAITVGGVERSVDLLVDDAGEVVVNVAHIGLGAEASRRADTLKGLLGPLGYPFSAAAVAAVRGGDRMRVVVDDEEIVDAELLQVAVGNGRFAGGGGALLPEADPRDGALDVAVIAGVPMLGRPALALDLLRRRHHRREDVIYRRASHVEVTATRRALWCSSDGELRGPRRRFSWRIADQVLRMRLPA